MEYISMVENGARECSIRFLKQVGSHTGIPVPIIVYMSMDESDVPYGHEEDYRWLKPEADKILGAIFNLEI